LDKETPLGALGATCDKFTKGDAAAALYAAIAPEAAQVEELVIETCFKPPLGSRRPAIQSPDSDFIATAANTEPVEGS
jgi:hypothetical protein